MITIRTIMRLEARVAGAERRILAAARAWYAMTTARHLPSPDDRAAQEEWARERSTRVGRLILALGLDAEARGDLRRARRRRHRRRP